MQKWDLGWRSVAALGLILSFSAAAAPGQDFTIVVLPDTQLYSERHPKILEAQADWIVANRAGLNIVYVAHLGDITNMGDEKPEQWANASNSLYRLESATGLPDGIPYGVVPGNHDHRGGTSQYNKFFGVAHFSDRSYYGGHPDRDNNSHFDKFSASGLDFVVLYMDFDFDRLDYGPIDVWADGVLKSNAGRRAIVVSHDLLAVSGSFDPRGQAIYDNLRDNPNLFLMLCGHNHGQARRYDIHKDRTVITCLSDYQTWPEGGGGYLRIYTFSPGRNLVRVQTYSPWLDKFQTDPDSRFEFGYRMDAGPLAGLGVTPRDPKVIPGVPDKQ
ncbi:MAG: metallophosphoesterase [Verrucomicrobiae bacterium]